MTVYKRKVNYHETDKMGITHHSNYVKYMEEARIEFLENLGLPFELIEEEGIGSPVVSINVEYKSPTVFADVLLIEVRLVSYNGLAFEFEYTMKNEKDNKVCVSAKSKHCFVKDGKLYNFRRENNPMGLKLEEAVEK